MTQQPTSEKQRKPRKTFSKPFNPVGAIIEYLHIVLAVTLVILIISVPYVVLTKKPKYSSEGLLNINPYLPKVLYGVEDSNFIRSFEDWMRTQIKIVTSYPVLEAAIKAYEAQGFKWQFPGESTQSAVGRLAARIKVIQIRDTQLITVTSEAYSSAGLAELINSVIKAYIASIDNNNRSEDNYKLDLLRKERSKVQKDLDDGYRQLEAISLKYGTAITEEKNLYIYMESLSDLKKAYNKLVTDRIITESRIKALKSKSGTLKEMSISGLVAERIDASQGISLLIGQILGRIQEAKEQMVGLTEDNPRRALLKRRTEEMELQSERLKEWLIKNSERAVRDKLLDENNLAIENTRIDFLTASGGEKMLLGEMSRAQKEILDLNTAVLRAQTKRQDIQRLMETLTRINTRIDQIMMEFGSPGRISISALALTPEHPNVDPRTKMLPICFVIALLAGVGVALGREMSDSRIKRPSDLEKMLGFPITGFLLRADEEGIPVEDLYKIHFRHPHSFITQQLAEMVVKMNRERMDNGSKIFAFTGLGDGCGVTMLAMNLLAMSSVPRERRLFIDLNTRSPAASREPLKTFLNNARTGTLPEGFLDGVNDEFPFVLYPSAEEQRDHLVHSRDDLKTLLDELKNSFDMIVLDLPPVLLSADTQAIAPLADVSVLVALARHSIWGELMRSVDMLDNCGVNVISVVLTRVGFVRGGYLRKSLQAYQTLGGEKKRRLMGPGGSFKVILKSYYHRFSLSLRRITRRG